MKKTLMVLLMAVMGSAFSAEQGKAKQVSLAEARGRIESAVSDPKVMAELMKGLSAADQKQFLADVNKAISGLSGSVEEKTAKFLNANAAAMRSAAPGNLQNLVAETFATVPPESLTVIAESFASNLFNRDAGGAGKYTDAQFTQVATSTMKVVNERTAETDNGSARSAFAIVMFVNAANGSIPDLANTLIETLPNEDARELAKDEWIPAALGQGGRTQSYDPLLASADAGRRPDRNFTLVIAGPQHLDAMLGDLGGKNTDELSLVDTRTPVVDAVENPLIPQLPTLGADVPGMGGAAGDATGGALQEIGPNGEMPRPTPDKPIPDDEPNPYWLEK